jgi:hypothetical protein
MHCTIAYKKEKHSACIKLTSDKDNIYFEHNGVKFSIPIENIIKALNFLK